MTDNEWGSGRIHLFKADLMEISNCSRIVFLAISVIIMIAGQIQIEFAV